VNTSPNKIKVLRIINRFNLGGITYNVSYLSKYLPLRYETRLIGGPEEKGEGSSLFIPESLGLTPEVLSEMQRSVNPLADWYAYKKIRAIIRETRPDIVHTHASKAGAVGRLAAMHENVPIIVHTFHGHVFHGYFNKLVTSVIKAIERYLARKSDAIVAISELQKKDLCDKHGISSPDKTTVIPLGFDLERFASQQTQKRATFRSTYLLQPHEIAIGIIGRLAPVKDHVLFIKAFKTVQEQSGRAVRAFIIGDGDLKASLMQAARAEGLTVSDVPSTDAAITFTGWIKEADVALAGCDLIALSSLNEGTPVSLIEAQAAGRYIITTEVGGVRDILHPQCGRMSAPGNLHAFTHNLLGAVQEYESLSAQAGVASTLVQERFSYRRLCNDMDELYTRLLEAKGIIAQ